MCGCVLVIKMWATHFQISKWCSDVVNVQIWVRGLFWWGRLAVRQPLLERHLLVARGSVALQ